MKTGNSSKANPAAASKELIIGKKDQQPLGKQQQTFNRLIKKLEKLRRELAQTTATFTEKLDFYNKHLFPLEQKLTHARKDLVKRIFDFYESEKRLSRKDKEILLDVMAVQLDNIFAFGGAEMDDRLKAIFETVEGVSLEQARRESFAEIKNDIAETFEEMGFAVDLNDFHEDLSEAEMRRKIAELTEGFKEQAEAREAARPQRKKTRKQIEKEQREAEAEAIKNKSIAAIYKQLAKIFHPDLEQNPELKAQKEDLMKQLTAAYERNDLHALLRLELEWIEKEESNLDKLSEEKLAIYNQTLKEQIDELEREIFFAAENPRYQPLRRFGSASFGIKHLDLKREQRTLEKTVAEARKTVGELNGENAFAELKKLINIFTRSKQRSNLIEINIEDFFR